ncbi:hypothetical protein AKJ39_02545 [candidate division MSBL1 archaeon SCGC-AAA259J03]|uniref:acetate--CoA ligase (ADP-forming) n=1 Tax=candidate division MSBL1 archaeon SCGC-AAA259J03 TaxID=1698269 RepID=A0A656YWU5_9EURY|nr:hypothetical protein AKJ39_02545 [candidate division MSBL1 archaeon SCGC-AAA259J03]
MTIRKLFEPNSVAVVGASRDPKKLGHVIVKNLIEADFEGKIYPVNPETDEILDLKCYPSLDEAPKKTQLAVIVIPAKKVPSILKQCKENNVRNAIIISGGFSEFDEEGKELEEEVLEIAEEMGIRILGPNCQGINNTSNGLCATWPLVTKKGPLSIVTQSGTIAAALSHWAQEENIGIAKTAILGNKADIDEADIINYLAGDDETGVIALYLEGVEKGRKFLEAARKAAEEKPVVVLKGGKTELGAEAVKSHTQSYAGKYEIFESACRQEGIILVDSLTELYNVCKGIAKLPEPDGKNTIIVTSSGGSGILAVDAIEDLEINLIDLPEQSIERLEENLPQECILKNPLDLTGSATAETFDESIKILARYKDVQNMVIIVGDPISGIADILKERYERLPLIPVFIGMGKLGDKEKEKLRDSEIPVFSDPAIAMKVANSL